VRIGDRTGDSGANRGQVDIRMRVGDRAGDSGANLGGAGDSGANRGQRWRFGCKQETELVIRVLMGERTGDSGANRGQIRRFG
jgi:hypothetical protein